MLIHKAKKIGKVPNVSSELLKVFEVGLKNKINITTVDDIEKESVPDIVKRFDMKPLEVIPHKEFTKEEIEEADIKFVEKLIQLFRDVKNKVKI